MQFGIKINFWMPKGIKMLSSTRSSMKVIEEIRRLVEEECKKDTNVFGDEIWTNHILSVVKFAKVLAEKTNADQEIVEIAALLHDLASIRGEHQYARHHVFGAEEAERILKQHNYPKEKIGKVKHCIRAHRASQSVKRTTKEADCVANADAMAHFDNITSLLYFVFVRKKMSVEEGTRWLRNKLQRSWSKMTSEAREIVKDKYEASMTLLK